MIKSISTLLLFSLILAGCANIGEAPPTSAKKVGHLQQDSALKALKVWETQGKIAFLQKSKRQSASFNWQVDQNSSSQKLNLTTYLGINVLSLQQNHIESVIDVDGKTYHSDNLDQLIWQLTGFTLPTKALHAWIKGTTYLPSDNIIYDTNNLPSTLISHYNNRDWQINYQQHQQVAHYWLPKKITINQGDLTIKLAITRWTL